MRLVENNIQYKTIYFEFIKIFKHFQKPINNRIDKELNNSN